MAANKNWVSIPIPNVDELPSELITITELEDILDTELATKADSIHNHTIQNVTNLQSSLDSKAPLSHLHTSSQISDLQPLLATKSDITHNHIIQDVTGLENQLDSIRDDITSINTSENYRDKLEDLVGSDRLDSSAIKNLPVVITNTDDLTEGNNNLFFLNQRAIDAVQPSLDNKADIVHNHQISDVQDLQVNLNNKAPLNHNHDIANVNNLQTALDNKVDIDSKDSPIWNANKLVNISIDATNIGNGKVLKYDLVTNSLVYAEDNVGSDNYIDSTDDLTEGTSNLYYTNDRVNTLIDSIKGISNGLSFLDSNGKITDVQIPSNIVRSSELYSQLSTKADSVHAHNINEVNNLQSSLDNKAALNHTHNLNDIEDLDSTDDLVEGVNNLYYTDTRVDNRVNSIINSLKNQPEGLVSTDSNNKINASQIPDVFTTDTELTSGLATKADLTHTHIASDITNLTTDVVPEGVNNKYFPSNYKTKLDGIEEGATADQSIEEIRDGFEALTGNDRLDASAIKNLNIPDTTDEIVEGTTNLYFTNTRVDNRIDFFKGEPEGLASLNSLGVLESNQLPNEVVTDSELNTALLNKADTLHNHNINQVTGLTDELNNRALLSHIHSISNVTNLQTELDNKAEVNHTHSSSQINDLNTDNVPEGVSNLYYSQIDKDKLATIESGATADQTPIEIRDSLQSLTGTNRLDASAIKNLPQAGSNLVNTDDLNEGLVNFYYTESRVLNVIETNKGIVNGIAPLDTNTLIPEGYIPNLSISKIINLSSSLATKASINHTHVVADITDIGTAATRNVPVTGDATTTEVVLGNDSRLINSRTPIGSAGGDLVGSYPNPQLVEVVGVVGEYKAPLIEVDNKGRIISATEVINVANGVAGLDSNNKLDISVIPDNVALLTDLDTKADLVHTHSITQVTNLQSELDSKAPLSHSHPISNITNLQNELDSKANVVHNHTISNVTGLQIALDNKTDVGHSHEIEDVNNLEIELDSKAAIVHTHIASQITDLQPLLDAKVNSSLIGATNGIVPLNATTKIDLIYLPSDLATDTELTTKSDIGHTHVAANITDLGTAAIYNVPVNEDAGGTEVVLGSDTRLSNSRTPTGSAGGDLVGTYPNPSLINTAVAAGEYDAPRITIDTKGRITSAVNIKGVVNGIASLDLSGLVPLSQIPTIPNTNVSGLGTASTRNVAATGDAVSTEVVLGNDTRLTNSRTPSGSAGGVLTGSYPNPSINTSQVDHNLLLNYSANRHIDHSTISITAGNGLSGGGDLTATRTITLGTPSTLTAASNNSVTGTTHSHQITGFVPSTIAINTTTGLTGGGDLSANRTLSLANTSVVAASYTLANFTVDAQGRLTAASSTSIIPIANGGTGSSTQNFVDLTTTQPITGFKTFTGGLAGRESTGAINVNSAGNYSLEVRNTTGAANAAYMTFHRQGTYATRFGIDTDNELKFGGWTEGNVAYRLWTEKNLNPVDIENSQTITGAKTFNSFSVSSTGTSAFNNGNLILQNTTSNWVSWLNVGTAAPSFTTRSVGTKLLLNSALTGSLTDYAIGIELNHLWNSIPTNTAAFGFKWYGGTTQIAKLDGTGNLEIANSLTADGVKLNNTTLSSDVEVLDYYREDVWTPTLTGSTTAGSFTYGFRVASYTRVGRQVTVTCSIQVNGVTTAPTGNIQITGLPFTPVNTTNQFFIGSCRATLGSQAMTDVVAYISPNSTTVHLANNVGLIPFNGLSTTNFIQFTVTYFV